nr:uncharacterized protein LOC126517957 isoform X3 [Dermacentor andersoni]XP_054920554.1 uncharacterized protein LOC126517957 isoform X3 [Dermacentor andersoni]XP_054920555.1 uncharacterized protein LOC126517957 isoform X3 [Dermacentor andersoni]
MSMPTLWASWSALQSAWCLGARTTDLVVLCSRGLVTPHAVDLVASCSSYLVSCCPLCSPGTQVSKRSGILLPALRTKWTAVLAGSLRPGVLCPSPAGPVPAVPVRCYLASHPVDLVVSSFNGLVPRRPLRGSGDLPFLRSDIMQPTLQIWRPAVPRGEHLLQHAHVKPHVAGASNVRDTVFMPLARLQHTLLSSRSRMLHFGCRLARMSSKFQSSVLTGSSPEDPDAHRRISPPRTSENPSI